MNLESKKWLRDIADACAAVGRFTAGKKFSDYKSNEMLRSAVERKLSIIGEPFNQLEAADASVTQTFPEIRKIIGMRNRIVHGYDKIDEELFWDVAQNRLPKLETKVEKLLKQ